ncbi:DUF7309 domain-containing protein [Paenibacillus tepidiphilus]|uniref:DUF7309 domain-containing protein n=1 Tax=Paenibacillus tepidiphilus TaxID=2608683 RepID=UPI0012386674|nr:hypothetical protein [Paenibacillus tepidiphilus]
MKLPIEEARPLYAAAAAFKKLACWEWMTNSDIFGVQNPDNGEIGYCCIMGNGGEMYGMAVYPGTKGLEVLLRMLQGIMPSDPLRTQHCLMLSFDDRDELYPEEYQQLKALGLSFRGRNAWPTFRLYEPGYVPWPVLDHRQLAFFTLCLEQASEYAQAVRGNPELLLLADNGLFPVRVPESGPDGTISWSSRLLAPAPEVPPAGEPPVADFDELHGARVRKLPVQADAHWEIGQFFLPAPVQDGGRPFYPEVLLIGDEATGMILHSAVKDKAAAFRKDASDFLDLLEQLGHRPQGIIFADEPLARLWLPLLESIGIEAFMAEGLPLLEDAMSGIRDSFT